MTLLTQAVFTAASAQTPAGKVCAIWLPICAFVTLGLEHSVANMFLLPLGKAMGADLTWGDIVLHNLAPVTLGNVGGAFLFIALLAPAHVSAAAARGAARLWGRRH